MLADAAAEQFVQLERKKKIAWFTAEGDLPRTDAQLAELRRIREQDRSDLLASAADNDQCRRQTVFLPHAAPIDNDLRNPSKVAAATSQATAAGDDAVYPPRAASSFAHDASSHLAFTPGASDFFPNTKTIIDSRKEALAQFRQLCYFTLLRKRAESRLKQLQLQSAARLQQMQKQQQQTHQQADASSSAAQQQQQPQQRSAPDWSEFGSLVMGGLLDPLPNPAALGGFALSREVKEQVERRLNEAALREQGSGALATGAAAGGGTGGAASQQQSPAGGANKRDAGGKRSRSSDKQQTAQAASAQRSASKEHGGKAGDGGSQQTQADDGRSGARFAAALGSSNLQLLQPVRIGDLEVHPHLAYREPFLFRAQRMPRLPFPKSDYMCAGPKNALINFPASSAEVAEAPSEAPTPAGTARALTSGRAGSKEPRRASSADALQRQQHLAASMSGAGTGNSVPQSQVPERFALPAVSVETFEMPVTAYNKFRPPLATASGVQHVLACRDFPPEFCTDVPPTPLQAARPSLVPPRHQPLRPALQQLLFAPLPATMAEAHPDDDLSDDEDHDLVDAGDISAAEGGDADAAAAESRPGTSSSGKNNTKNKTAAAPVETAVAALASASSSLMQDAKKAAMYLCAPPLSLDDALSALSIVVAPQPHGGAGGNSAPSTAPEQATRRPAAGASAQQHQQQQQGVAASAQQQLQQRLALLPPAVRAALELKADQRLAFTPQPVHSEDAFDENDAVARTLRDLSESFDRRRAAMPAHVQHLV